MKNNKDLDFSKGIRNPYYEKAIKGELKFVYKQQITIRLDNDIIDYFRNMSFDYDIPYQSLINMYLRDCVKNNKKLNWK